MFNLAIDSTLRRCEIVRLRESKMLHPGVARSTGQPRRKKTGEPVKFELTEQTREMIDNYIATAKKQPGEFLFGGRRGRDRLAMTRQCARLVGQCIAGIGLDRGFFGTRARRSRKSILPRYPVGSTVSGFNECGPNVKIPNPTSQLVHRLNDLVRLGSFPAVPTRRRRGSSTSISGPRPANLGGPLPCRSYDPVKSRGYGLHKI
jgi:hypothetical protein